MSLPISRAIYHCVEVQHSSIPDERMFSFRHNTVKRISSYALILLCLSLYQCKMLFGLCIGNANGNVIRSLRIRSRNGVNSLVERRLWFKCLVNRSCLYIEFRQIDVELGLLFMSCWALKFSPTSPLYHVLCVCFC